MFEVHVMIISLFINIALIALVLLQVRPKINNWITQRKKQAERRKITAIRKIVREYLKELQK